MGFFPLSPYLFLLSAELLGDSMRNDGNIHGFQINGIETKISQYADDTLIFVDGKKYLLLNAMDKLRFRQCSKVRNDQNWKY